MSTPSDLCIHTTIRHAAGHGCMQYSPGNDGTKVAKQALWSQESNHSHWTKWLQTQLHEADNNNSNKI